MGFILPAKDKRTVVVGSTGSGKTFLAVWLLSTRDFHIRPWIIIDYKRDKLISQLGAQEISVKDKPPTKAGLYVVRPIRGVDDDAITEFLWRVWENENTGIYLDEGYMIDRNDKAMSALLTQGRSKNIEMINLVQRPVWCNKMMFSEANHFYVMRLQVGEDRKFISSYLDDTPIDNLPKFHSHWYSADEQETVRLAPVPARNILVAEFARRLAAQKKRKAI